MQNFRIRGQTLLAGQEIQEKKERCSENNSIYSGHYVMPAMSMGNAFTWLSPIYLQFVPSIFIILFDFTLSQALLCNITKMFSKYGGVPMRLP